MEPLAPNTIHTFLIVRGNCEICKERIEKAALSVGGVSLASWNILDNKLYLAFDTTRTHLDEISVAVAKSGHDTNLHKAGQSTREQMPQCCKTKP